VDAVHIRDTSPLLAEAVKPVGAGGRVGFPKVTEIDWEALFPAMSVAETAIVLAPAFSVTEQLNDPPCSVAATPLHVVAAISERASVALPETVTVEAVETKPLAGELIVSTGGVLSRLTLMLAVALFPALSVTVPLIA
jgi:hypothetical protein